MRDVDAFLDVLVSWAQSQRDVTAVGLAGSHARGTAEPDSDVDLILVVDDVEARLKDRDWLASFGSPVDAAREDWGLVQALRVRYADGLEVEFGFTTAVWIALPLDDGTAEVLRRGFRILHDPSGTLLTTTGGVTVQPLELGGIEALRHSIRAAQVARLRRPTQGLWEAADLAWWWRQPRATDSATTRVWTDAGVPVRAVRPVAWNHGVSVEVVGLEDAVPAAAVADAIERGSAETGAHSVSAAASPGGRWHDEHLVEALLAGGWSPTRVLGGGGWTSTAPAVSDLPDDVTVVSMTGRAGAAHHMADRVGDDVQERLGQTGLYDPRFDLVALRRGEVVGNALGWLDTVTATGLIEPVAVAEAHRRRGIATRLVTQLTSGLLDAGAQRVRINWEQGGEASRLYRRLGFGDDIRMWALERR